MVKKRLVGGEQIVVGMVLGEAYKNPEFSIEICRYLSLKYEIKLKILGSPNAKFSKPWNGLGCRLF